MARRARPPCGDDYGGHGLGGNVSIEIVAPTRDHAERLADAVGADFRVELREGGGHTVAVTPSRETAGQLVALFDAIGRWLDDGGLASCDVRFGDRGLTVLAATSDDLGDPTAFLVERSRQLEQALSSRIVIEQAKGVLSERHGIGVEAAFERLRREARSARRNIHDVAADILGGQERI